MISEEKVKMYQDNIKLSTFAIKKWLHSSPPELREELTGEARVGLWRACVSFDPSKGLKFSTFAYACIQRQCMRYLRKMIAQKRTTLLSNVSLDSIVYDNGGSELELNDFIGREPDFANQVFAKEVKKEIMEDKVLRLRFIEGLKQEEIGEILGLSQTQVSRRIKSKREKLREKYKEAL
jgi:RNA polymerase sigma factor (sigma-70 family)